MAIPRKIKISHDIGLAESVRNSAVHQGQTFANQFDPERVSLVKFAKNGQATIAIVDMKGHEVETLSFPTAKELCIFVEGYNTALSSRNPFKKWS